MMRTRESHKISTYFVFVLACFTALMLHAQQAISPALNNHRLQVVGNLDDCVRSLDKDHDQSVHGLNSESIQLVNWNVEKGFNPIWVEDLEEYAVSANLITLQEAMLLEHSNNNLASRFFWSFAEGYQRGAEYTGVTTYSKSRPLLQCNLQLIEPWLRTPKATGVTQYALTGTTKKLLVINLHAVNYTIGLSAFRRQFGQIDSILRAHSGPVIFTGDFNTWNNKRKAALDEFAERTGLSAVPYPEDNRVTFFGHVVDYIYYRDLTLVDARSQKANSSDHTPVLAEFTL